MAKDSSFYEFYATAKSRVFYDAFEDAGFKVGAGLIWKKPRAPLSRTDWKFNMEPIIFGWRKDGKHVWYGDQKQTAVFEFDGIKNSKDDGFGHPLSKPVPLIAYLIKQSTMTNGIVLDGFLGYKGDLQFQKTPARDVITEELDEIQVDMYVTDHHEAIVSRELWDKAQERMALFKARDPRARRKVHFLTQRVICGECGSIFRRRTNPDGKGGKVIVWKCRNRELNQQCGCRYIKEQVLFDSIKGELDIEECTAQTTANIKKIVVFNNRIELE